MKRLVLEVSSLFGELAIEKVNNMYRLTQEDDMLYFTPSEIIHLTQIEYPYTDKIVSINDEHKIHFYSSCPGFNIKSESMCLSVIHWDSFIAKIKYLYYSNERKHSLKWFKKWLNEYDDITLEDKDIQPIMEKILGDLSGMGIELRS